MRYPDHLIDQIRLQTDIVELVGEVVALKRRGSNYIGLCPFHNEKTPSFNVSAEKGIYKCFGCGKGGNVYTFLQDYHKLNFPEAVKQLAHRANVVLPEKDISPQERERIDLATAAGKAMAEAAAYWHRLLFTEAGRPALEYLRKRGFGEDTIKTFLLGFAPDSWDATGKELDKLGFEIEHLTAAGLVKERESGGHFDFFRNRITFPIWNVSGRVIGAGARVLPGDSNPAKYVNSPQSALYDKSAALYGLFQARDEIRRKEAVLVVEGYADVIGLYQAGVRNVVAASGTSLTHEQVHRLKRYCSRMFLVFDADAAGANAAIRGIDIALRENMDVSIVTLPEGEDPDSLVLKQGLAVFEQRLTKAVDAIEFKGSLLQQRGEMDSPEGAARALRSIVATVALIPDHLKREFHIKRLAERLHVREETLYAELREANKEKTLQVHKSPAGGSGGGNVAGETKTARSAALPRTAAPSFTSEAEAEAAMYAEAEAQAQGKAAEAPEEKLSSEEELLLRCALAEPRSFEYIITQMEERSVEFTSDIGRRIFGILLNKAENHADPLNSALSDESIGEADRAILSGLAVDDFEESPNWGKYGNHTDAPSLSKMLDDALSQLLRMSYSQRMRAIQAQMAENTSGADLALLQEFQELRGKLAELDERFSTN